MADPLEKASVWTDEEIEWIEEHGGYIYGRASGGIDDQTNRVSDDNAGTSRSIQYQTDRQIGGESDEGDSLWDKVRDWFSDGYNKVATTLVDAYDYSRDWIDQRLNRLRWGDVQLIGDITSTVDTAINKEDWLNAVLIGDFESYVDQDINAVVDRVWWDDLSIDFPEFSLDPLTNILARLVDNVSARIEGFIANALDIRRTR